MLQDVVGELMESGLPRRVMTPLDGCAAMTAVVETGHRSFLGPVTDPDQNNNSDPSMRDAHSSCSNYDPVKYLSAITEQSIFGHSQRPVATSGLAKTNGGACDNQSPLTKRSLHQYNDGNNDNTIMNQDGFLVSSWAANGGDNNNHIVYHHHHHHHHQHPHHHQQQHHHHHQQQQQHTRMDDLADSDTKHVYANLNTAWRSPSSSSSPHHHLSSSSSSSPSPFSLTSSSSSSSSSNPPASTTPLSSSCMHAMTPSNVRPSDPDPDPSLSPSGDNHVSSSTSAMTTLGNPGFYQDNSFLFPSTPPSCDQPTFLANSLTPPGYGGQEENSSDSSWDQEVHGDENSAIMAWRLKHPFHWSSGDVLDWIFSVAVEHGLNMKDLRAERFQGVVGSELCRMKLNDFLHLEPIFGGFLFEMLEKLIDNARSTPPEAAFPTTAGIHSPLYKSEPQNYSTASHIPDTPSAFPLIKPDERSPPFYSECFPQPSPAPFPTPLRHPCCSPTVAFPAQVLRRRAGKPRVRNLQFDVRDGKDKKAKNQHLWEFIYETLMSPSHNPQFLRWENQREGVFRFVQSEAVAQLWGRRKNNENMTYEKLSRAMRHYYRRGILERVEGRRLVYKFSMKAIERIKSKKSSSI